MNKRKEPFQNMKGKYVLIIIIIIIELFSCPTVLGSSPKAG